MNKNFNTPEEEFKRLIDYIKYEENEKHRCCPLSSYKTSIDQLEEFANKIINLISITENYAATQKQINTLASFRSCYQKFVFNENPVITAKVETVGETLRILKKQELTDNPCYENVEIFNLLNGEDYTHFADVINWVAKAHDGDESAFNSATQRRLCKSIENSVYDNRRSLQQLNYLIDDLETYKRLIKLENDYSHKKINWLKGQIDFLKKKRTRLQAAQNDSYQDIETFLNAQSYEALSLIFAFCSQLSLFEVVTRDNISEKNNALSLLAPSRSSYCFYINRWTRQLIYSNFWRVQ